MVDPAPAPAPETPAIPALPQIDAAKQLAALQDLQGNFSKLGQITQYASSAFSTYTSSLRAAGVSLQNLNGLTQQQQAIFAGTTTAMLGTRKAFESLENIDVSGLNTFGQQFLDVGNIILNGTGGISKFADMIKGTFGETAPAAAKKSKESMLEWGKGVIANFVASADNSVKFQNAVIQLSAHTGDLGDVYAEAGTKLENLNSILDKQRSVIDNSTKATGLSEAQVEKYWGQLAHVPGALKEVVRIQSQGSDTTSMLTATIRLATGAGMKYTDVIGDLTKAYHTFGATGEVALKFTARMAEMSQTYNLQIADVRNGLLSATDVFKSYGAAGEKAGGIFEGVTRTMNNYVEALKKSGLSGKEAIEVTSNLIKRMGDLNLAQRSFLSAQTGGAGGLMGGYQIEKMIKEGKIDEVMEKARATLTKQFGKIATVEEAAQSPEAAARLTKQRMMLQQGPLGQFAKNEQEASRILEAFAMKDRGEGGEKQMSDAIVQSTMDKGLMLQETTATEASRIRALLETSMSQADRVNYTLMQRSQAIRTGSTDFNTWDPDGIDKVRQSRAAFMQKGAAAGGVKDETPLVAHSQTRGREMAGILGEAVETIESLPSIITAPLELTKKALLSNDIVAANKQMNLTKNSIAARIKQLREEQKKTNADHGAITTEIEGLNKASNVIDSILPASKPGATKQKGMPGPQTANKPPAEWLRNFAAQNIQQESDAPILGAANSVEQTNEAAKAKQAGSAAANQSTASGIHVMVEGICIICKKSMEEGRAQATAVNPASIRG
jgi:hypothetical protein